MSLTQSTKITFTKHLAVMVKAGITLSEALDNLINQSSSELKNILKTVKNKIDNGSTFYQALSLFPQDFDQIYLGIIKVGEKTGRLDESLGYLVDQLTKDYLLRKKIRGALMYPALVLTATISLATFISLFILPKLVDFFTSFDAKLPLSTQILLSVSRYMKDYGLVSFSIFLGFSIFLILIFRLPPLHLWLDRQILKVPFFGELLVKREVAFFSRNLSTLIKSGLPIYESLSICLSAQHNLEYRKTISLLSQNLETGGSFSKFFNTPSAKLLFPELVADMVSVGEKTGSIEQSLSYVSQFYEDDIDEFTQNLTTILEPAILLVIGLMVAFIALAIIGPIYQLTGSLG